MVRGRRFGTALATGLSLAQIGEFSFVSRRAGLPLGLFGAGHYEVFLAVAALSMLVAPFLVMVSRSWAVRLGARSRAEPDAEETASRPGDTPSSSATVWPGAIWRGCCKRPGSNA